MNDNMEDDKKSQECIEWAEILALTPVHMLLPGQQEALTAHIQHCKVCETIVAQYERVDQLLYDYFTVETPTFRDPPPLPITHWQEMQERRSYLRHLSQIFKEWMRAARVRGVVALSMVLVYLSLLAVVTLVTIFVLIWHLPLSYVGIVVAFAMLLLLFTVGQQETMEVGFRLAWSSLQTPEADLWRETYRDDIHSAPSSSEKGTREHLPPTHPLESSRQSHPLKGRLPYQRGLRRRRLWLAAAVLLFGVSTVSLGIVLLNSARSPTKPSASQGISALTDISTDGSHAFDLNRPDGDLKRQAANAMASGHVSEAENLWKQALAVDSSDAEVLIYQENQQVVVSKLPYTTIVVGTFLLNGNTGDGRDNLQGVYLVQKEHNDAVQIHGGVMLRLVIAVSEFDDASTTVAAEQVVQLAHQDRTVVGVMGWPTSNQTLAALKVLAAAHLPLVSPTATSDVLTGMSPYFFRVAPSDTQQGEVAATYVKQVLQNKRVALFEDPHNPYSYSLAKAFRKSFVNGTHSIVYDGSYTVQGDPTELVRDVQYALAQKPDLFYFAGYVNDASIVVQHLPACTQQSCLKMMGGDGLDVQGDYSLETYKSYGRLLFTSFAFANNRQDQGLSENDPFFGDYAQAFDPQDQYRQGTYGHNLADADAMLSYDATQVLLDASAQLLARGKIHFNGDDLRLALTQVTGPNAFQGVSGRISFGHDGNVIGKAVLVLVGQSDGQTALGSVSVAP